MNEIQGRLPALKEKGWTMAAISDELGVSNMTVFTWKNGTRNAENARSVLFKLDSLLAKEAHPEAQAAGPQDSLSE